MNDITKENWSQTDALDPLNQMSDIKRDVFNQYFYHLKGLAISRFRWNNLPEGILSRNIEIALLEDGYAIIQKIKKDYKDQDDKLLVKGTPTYKQIFGAITHKNMFGEPLKIKKQSYIYNGNEKEKGVDSGEELTVGEDCFVIWDNYTYYPLLFSVKGFAEQLTAITATEKVNLNAQKTPIILSANPETIKSVKTMLNDFTDDKPFLILKNDFKETNPIETVSTSAPYLVDKLSIYKNRIYNEFYSQLGIHNANQDKKERLVVAEVGANDDPVEVTRNNYLNCRKESVETMNKLTGLNVSVQYSIIPELDETDNNEESEVENDKSKD